MNILFLSRWFPYPPGNGSKLRIYNLLRGLARQHQITLLSFADQPDVDANAPALRSICQEVRIAPWKPFTPGGGRALLASLGPTPRSVVDTHQSQMAQCIEQLLAARRYDLVIASQIAMAGYSRSFAGTPALFEEVQLGMMYEQYAHATSPPRRLRYGLTWLKHRRYLARLLTHFRTCTVASERERQLLAQAAPGYGGDIEVIPNCITLADYEDAWAEPRPNTLIFAGSFTYGVNFSAMRWFLSQVYPHVLAQIPDATLTITGDHANRPLPPVGAVHLTGFVEDVRPLIAASWISLAPIWQGGGTRLKILEAMALRTPVVATSKGAEGLDVQHGQHLLIADTPQTFAQAIIRLLQEPGLRQRLVANAYRLVQERYDSTAVIPRFLVLVEQVASARRAPAVAQPAFS